MSWKFAMQPQAIEPPWQLWESAGRTMWVKRGSKKQRIGDVFREGVGRRADHGGL